MRFGTWDVRSLYGVGSLTAAVRDLARFKLDLFGVQQIRLGHWGMARAGDYDFVM
jgi:hypothetical protein